MEIYFKSFFEKLRHTPKEFAVKYVQNSINTEVLNVYSLTLTFRADFFADIEPNQFHTSDSFTGNIINIGGIIHYENRKYIKRYFIKGHGNSWLTKDDGYLFHKPFGDYRESHSFKKNVLPHSYLIEYFPLGEVIEKIRRVYVDDLEKMLPFNLIESFQFENSNFKYTVDFVSKDDFNEYLIK